MTDYLMVGDRARWSVLWVVKKPKKPLRIVEKEFENDFNAALDLYMKAKAAGKPFATLRCCNTGFPPPEQYRPYWANVVVGKRRVKRQGKYYMKKVREDREFIPMQDLNLKGIWWCPYCREMRKFQHWEGYHSTQLAESPWVPDVGMYCPICGINQRDHHVRKWNPQAQTLEFRLNTKRRRSSGRQRSSRARRRRS